MHDILPANVRSKAYTVYAVLGLVLGSTQVGFAAAEASQPVALTVGLAVYAFVGGAFGFVAHANTPGPNFEGETCDDYGRPE